MEEGFREPWSWGGPWGTPPTLRAGWGTRSASPLPCQQHRTSDIGWAKCQAPQGKMGFAVKWVWLFLGFAQTSWKKNNKKPGLGYNPGTGHLKDHTDA